MKSFIATFGGAALPRTVGNVLPVPSSAHMQYLRTPAGALSIFAFQTPIPFPFGEERTGYLVTDMDRAVKAARAAVIWQLTTRSVSSSRNRLMKDFSSVT